MGDDGGNDAAQCRTDDIVIYYGKQRCGQHLHVHICGWLFDCLGLFSLVATFAQWALTSNMLLDGMMQSTSQILGAILLISAGAYQFLPVKDACLRHCQTPIQFVMGRGIGCLGGSEP